MTYRYIIFENENDFNTINQLFVTAPAQNMKTHITERSIENMRKTPLTKVIIASKNNSEKLKLIKSKFEELMNWKV